MQELKLKPCPVCGHVPNRYDWQSASDCRLIQRYCSICDMTGPRARRPEDADAAWNALPRRLRWTKEKPTETGWYWYKDSVTKPIMCLVTTLDHQLIMNADRRYQNALIDKLDGEFDEKWAGPIPEPEE